MRYLTMVLLAWCISAVGAGEGNHTPPPVVDSQAMQIQMVRHQGGLYRITRFSTESLYPCLRFERLLPGDVWKIDAQRDICSVRTGQDDTVDFIDTSYTGFRSLRFEEGAFRFEVEYIPTHSSGERVVSCSLPVGSLEDAEPLSCFKAAVTE